MGPIGTGVLCFERWRQRARRHSRLPSHKSKSCVLHPAYWLEKTMPSRVRCSHRASRAPTIDARSDSILVRQIRMLKPELAQTGFRMKRWEDVAVAVNNKLAVRKFKTGQAAQRRFGVLRSVYDDDEQRETMPADVVTRMDDYFDFLDDRRNEAAEVKRKEAGDSGDGVDYDHAGHDQEEEEELLGRSPRADSPHQPDDAKQSEDDEVEEIEFKREVNDAAPVDLTSSRASYTDGYAIALPRSRESILFGQVQAQQKLMQSLVDMLKKDREDHRQEIRELMRFAARK